MSDNIIDFNKRRRELIEKQPVSEVPMTKLLKGLTSVPKNDLMADVARSVHEKITRLLIMTDIASKASDMLSAYGFDPNNFNLEFDSMNRFLSGEMGDDEDALWNGPFFDWDAEDSNNSTVRVVSTVHITDEDENDVSIRLALELLKLGQDDENWSRFVDGAWVQDGPPADFFDDLELVDLNEDDWGDDEDDDEDDWDDDDDESSIYMHDFSNGSMKALTLAGIETVDQLKAMSDEQLAAIDGLTQKDLKRIRRVLADDEC